MGREVSELTEPSSLFLTHPLMLKIKTILLWLKGLENLEDESVIEKFPAFSQHLKKNQIKNHKSIRNSVVCLFGVLCKLYYTLSTITTTKIRSNNRYLNRLKEKIWKINDKTLKKKKKKS